MNRILYVLYMGAVLTLSAWSQTTAVSKTIVFHEKQFPAADTITPTELELHTLFPHATFADADSLPLAISQSDIQLLVLPYGSAFPENDWPGIFDYLNRGGNLLVLGGKAFS